MPRLKMFCLEMDDHRVPLPLQLMSRFDLHNELKPHLNGCVLRHPFLKYDHAWPAFYFRLNVAFEVALQSKKPIDLDAPSSEVSERHDRFLSNPELVDSAKHYREFGDLWTHPELIALSSDFVAISVDLKHRNRFEIMTEDEQLVFAKLPNEIELFRAHAESLQGGRSWTLDYDVATSWGLGLPQNTQISRGFANKQEAIAYISRRGESEVLIPGRSVTIIETEDLK